MEKVVAFIVARLSSSRLPKKQLRKIGDRRLIDWTIENVKKSTLVDEVVIATTNEDGNLPLVDVAYKHNIGVFSYNGDINDVVGRLVKASKKFNADIPILISGDCPLIWPNALDKLVEKIMQDRELDHVYFCKKNGKIPIHEGMGVYRRKCWELADRLSDKPNLREHQFPIVGLKPELFKVDCVECDDIFYKVNHRISVDTLADLEFMNAVYNELKKLGREFNLKNVVELLIEKPELMEINKDVHQIRIDEKPRKVVFVVNKEENLEIYFKLAYQLTKMGVGVRFFAVDSAIRDRIEKAGYGVIERLNKDEFDIVIEDSMYKC